MAVSAKDSQADHRGRGARRPEHIPAKGWLDVGKRVFEANNKDNVSIVAAGVAFYALLSLFPAITAAVLVYGLVADPGMIQQQVEAMQGVLPQAAIEIISSQMTSIAQGDSGTLGVGLAITLGIAIYSASKGVGALIASLNIVYGEEENRGFFKMIGIKILYTFGAIVMALVLLGAVAALPAVLAAVGLPTWSEVAIRVGRWLALLGILVGVLAFLYATAPDRARPTWPWVRPGAIAATLLWLVASLAFSFYVANFASYNKTFGSAAALIILMMWFWLTAYVILLGAELNVELEKQTREDSTAGPERALGERRAEAADTVAGAR